MADKELARGDLIQIDWWDVTEDPVGAPDRAHPAKRTTYAMFWEVKDYQGCDVLVTTNTLDTDVPDQQGWCAYPTGMIENIRIIKRAKKGRRKKESGYGKAVKNGDHGAVVGVQPVVQQQEQAAPVTNARRCRGDGLVVR